MTPLKKTTLLLLSSIFLSSYIATAQTVTVTPIQYNEGMNNPYMGFRNGISNAPSNTVWKKNEYNTIYRHYIKWGDIESNETDGVQKIIDFCNKAWNGAPAANVTFIPRVYIDWDSNANNEYWPADILVKTGLQSNDPALWAHPIVKDRIVKLIAKLGQAWDNDPRVAWVQTGLLGYWGEQENPVGTGTDGWAKRLGDAYSAAFINKKLIVRNQPDWDALGYKWGVYWDSYGHPGQRSGAWTKIQNTNATGRWLTTFIEGEVAYDWGLDKLGPLYGIKPYFTMNNYKYANNMIDVIKELHCSGLGWISSYPDVPSTDLSLVNRDSINANASRMQKEFGYRFVLSDFTSNTRTEAGALFDFSFKVKNTASAPFYYKWPLALLIIDEATRQIIEKITIHNVDISKWLPGDKYSYNTRSYQTAALQYTINGSVKIPSNLAKGKYLVGIAILEPSTLKPGIFFAMNNFFRESQSQPIIRIGVGEDVSSPELSTVRFDDPKRNDTRSYNMTKNTFTLTVTPSADGLVTTQSSYPTLYSGDAVSLTATPKVGYEFDSWGGDLIGKQNPIMIFMTQNINVTANYKVKTGISDASNPNSKFLGQNYPNPFTNSTTIPFEFVNDSNIKINVCNSLGQEVATIFNEKKSSGKHTFIWNGTNTHGNKFPSGIYTYKLISDHDRVLGSRLMVIQ